ncbi:hypothetical protein C8J57DRAFT_1570689 [Mycena rebaudengoi]|nr:hypothetical protein C8J57DRAFT_1570689 [Mycena rebaudengoi]
MPGTTPERHVFFKNSRNLKIYGGTFINGNIRGTLRKPTSHYPSHPPIVRKESLNLLQQLVMGPNYRIHAAEMDGRAVAVKVFNGHRAQQDRDEAEAISRNLMHSNFLCILGWSPKVSPDPFIVYHGAIEDSADRMLAAILREDLLKCLVLGVTMSGLSYLENKKYPVEYAEPANFDLLIDGDGNLKICLKEKPVALSYAGFPVKEMETRQRQDALELLDSLCRTAFKDANRILYCNFPHFLLQNQHAHLLAADEVDRTEFVPFSLDLPSASNLNLSEGPQFPSVESTSMGSAERRELVWKSSDKTLSLEQVSQQLEDFLFCLRTARAKRNIERYLLHGTSTSHHRCPGYSREEIILGSQAQSTIIILHSTPSPQEICTVCGQVVEAGGWFDCSCGIEVSDDGQEPTKHCPVCNVWRHIHCFCALKSALNMVVARKLRCDDVRPSCSNRSRRGPYDSAVEAAEYDSQNVTNGDNKEAIAGQWTSHKEAGQGGEDGEKQPRKPQSVRNDLKKRIRLAGKIVARTQMITKGEVLREITRKKHKAHGGRAKSGQRPGIKKGDL